MSQKLTVNGFKCVEDVSGFDQGFITVYNEKNKKGYFLEVYAQYPKNIHKPHNDLVSLPERMKTERIEKLVANLHDKTEYFISIRNLEQALNHGLVLQKVHRVIKFNRKAWLKSYTGMKSVKKKEKMTLK